MYILIYLRILKLYYHILDKGDGRSGKVIAPFKIEKGGVSYGCKAGLL